MHHVNGLNHVVIRVNFGFSRVDVNQRVRVAVVFAGFTLDELKDYK